MWIVIFTSLAYGLSITCCLVVPYVTSCHARPGGCSVIAATAYILEIERRSSNEASQDMSQQQYKLSITVLYTGVKATQYFSKLSRDAVNRLKEDLRLLKFPLPKSDNVSFISHGCMGAFWIASLESVREKLAILCPIKSYNLISKYTTVYAWH
jgi:hypothetical protein